MRAARMCARWLRSLLRGRLLFRIDDWDNVMFGMSCNVLGSIQKLFLCRKQ